MIGQSYLDKTVFTLRASPKKDTLGKSALLTFSQLPLEEYVNGKLQMYQLVN